jgi:hypothetical protein
MADKIEYSKESKAAMLIAEYREVHEIMLHAEEQQDALMHWMVVIAGSILTAAAFLVNNYYIAETALPSGALRISSEFIFPLIFLALYCLISTLLIIAIKKNRQGQWIRSVLLKREVVGITTRRKAPKRMIGKVLEFRVLITGMVGAFVVYLLTLSITTNLAPDWIPPLVSAIYLGSIFAWAKYQMNVIREEEKKQLS